MRFERRRLCFVTTFLHGNPILAGKVQSTTSVPESSRGDEENREAPEKSGRAETQTRQRRTGDDMRDKQTPWLSGMSRPSIPGPTSNAALRACCPRACP